MKPLSVRTWLTTTVARLVMAHGWSNEVTVPWPSCPYRPRPHEYTRPHTDSATLWCSPATPSHNRHPFPVSFTSNTIQPPRADWMGITVLAKGGTI
jgi:hypothetical protein